VKHVFYFIVMVLWLVSSHLFAEESSASAQCDQAATQVPINKALLEKVCLQAAQKAETDKNYDDASWYYLLAGKIDYLLSDIKKHSDTRTNQVIYSNIGHAYMLSGDSQNAAKNYQQFLKMSAIPWANSAMQDDYKILQQLYPDKKLAIKQELKQWNKLYAPYQAIDTLAQQYREANKKKQYKKALVFLEKIKRLLENRDQKNEAYHLAYNYKEIVNVYKGTSNHTKALKYQLKILAIEEKILGEQHPDTATNYNNVGVTYSDMGDQIRALQYQRKALAIREKTLGKQHPATIESYNDIGLTYRYMGHYDKSLKFNIKFLSIVEKILGDQHPNTATSYNNIGGTYRDLGEHAKALEYQRKALAIQEKVLGKQHPSTARSYNNIGTTYYAMGDYANALKYQLKALAIREKILDKQHPAIARSYNNIGAIYHVMGDYTKGLEYRHKALVIQEKVLGKQHPDTANSYNSIGATYHAMADYLKALEYFQKNLAILDKVSGEQPLSTAIGYNNIGETHHAMGDHAKALKYKLKALAIWEKVLGKQHSITATGYNNIGSTYGDMGDYIKALQYQRKALAIREKTLGKQHPFTGISYNNIGSTYGDMGNHPKAYEYAQKAFAIFLQQRDNNFSALDSAQKKHYLIANENKIYFLLDHANHYQKTLFNNKDILQSVQLAQTTLNDWLAYKGSILDNENRLVSFAKTSKDPAIQQKYQQLVTLKQTYSTLNQNYPKNEKQQETWKQKLKQYETQIATLEQEITQGDPRFKTEKALQAINSETIAKGLKPTELYIDYGKTNAGYYLFTIDHNNQISFSAFSKKDSKAIDQQLKLFNEDIAAIFASKKIPKGIQENSQASLTQLYQLLIPSALAAKIATKDSLIISPDGALRLLPFEALYHPDKKQYLIEQKDIRYIASGKELVRLFRQQQQAPAAADKDKAVIFANPAFDQTGIKKNKTKPVIYTRNTQRVNMRGGMFELLDGTRIEAEGIIKILRKTKATIRYYHQSDATEANLLTIKQPTILHIATHGFFDGDTPNPMLQSGLVFAGANVSFKNGTDQGIVTALDLSGLDLKGTDLVVLSACDTGKVDPNNTNGVSGLTKAFIQAGANNVVMSLWSVADTETLGLMQSFYQASEDNKHKNKRHYSRALKQSKLAMIKQGLHPYYWAAFVLSGL